MSDVFSPLVFTFQRLRAEFVYDVQTYAQREVCLKHRNNRREKIPAGVTPSNVFGVAAVFVLFVVNDAAARHVPIYIDRRGVRSVSCIIQAMRSSSKQEDA